MINVADLENRWVKFKIKSYIPYAVIIGSLVVISILSLIFFNSEEKDNSAKVYKKTDKVDIVKKQQTIKPIPAQPQKTEVQKAVPQNNTIVQTDTDKNSTTQNINKPIVSQKAEVKTTKKKLLLKPSLNFMRDMQDDTLPYYEDEQDNSSYNVKKKIKNTPTLKKPEHINKVQTVQKEQEVDLEPKKSSITIHRENTQEDIHYVIKRFKTNNNPALSLFIAKKYYELGEYRKSYNYALITNGINSNIEASWIIFAKSLVKLNEKDIAIKTLRTYIDHSGSNKAKILLDEIISGKFK